LYTPCAVNFLSASAFTIPYNIRSTGSLGIYYTL
jgi:hypothetical protein